MARKAVLNSLTVLLLLVAAVLIADLGGLFRVVNAPGHEPPVVNVDKRKNRITNISVQDRPGFVRYSVEYILEDRYRGRAGIRGIATEAVDGKTVMEAYAPDTGESGVEIIFRRSPSLNYPVNTSQILFHLVSKDDKVLAENKIQRPIRWASQEIGRKEILTPPEMYQVEVRLHELFNKGEFKSLDNLCEQWKRGQQRTIDGRWQLEGFKSMPGYGLEDGWWERNTRILRSWRNSNKESECAAIMEVEAWIGYAKQWNGPKPRNSEDKLADNAYKKRLEMAEQVLLESKTYSADNPLWFERYIFVLNLLGRDKHEIFNVFIEAIGKEKYYYPVYSTTAVAMTPRWAGDYRIVDRIAIDALKLTQDKERNAVYTRIYWAVDKSMLDEGKLFKDTYVSWPKMKQGFEEIISQYPDSAENLNHFASFACQAGDGEKFLELRNQVTPNITGRSAWNSNYSLDVCDHMFMKRL